MKKIIAAFLLTGLFFCTEPVFSQHVLLLQKNNLKSRMVVRNNNKIKYLLANDTISNIDKMKWVVVKEIKDSSLLFADGREVLLNDMAYICSNNPTPGQIVLGVVSGGLIISLVCLTLTDPLFIILDVPFIIIFPIVFMPMIIPDKKPVYDIQKDWKAFVVEKGKIKEFLRAQKRL